MRAPRLDDVRFFIIAPDRFVGLVASFIGTAQEVPGAQVASGAHHLSEYWVSRVEATSLPLAESRRAGVLSERKAPAVAAS